MEMRFMKTCKMKYYESDYLSNANYFIVNQIKPTAIIWHFMINHISLVRLSFRIIYLIFSKISRLLPTIWRTAFLKIIKWPHKLRFRNWASMVSIFRPANHKFNNSMSIWREVSLKMAEILKLPPKWRCSKDRN